ncbi:prepilin-type N-terminal cleavage/methylation domain-containing protein [Planococcus sp. 11815]|uniref:prepilin-type N-terminal cleavage/methylation domain-containing protein n=1 Tax=Planococcus sp. 11815 TaxID=2939413 RepID=UPI003DA358DB
MKKFLQKKLKDQKGMTLIELLAVIVIIAIIAAIAIPAISNLIQNSREDALVADAQNVLSAASLYFAENEDKDEAVLREASGVESEEGSVSASDDLAGYLESYGNITSFTVTKDNGDGVAEIDFTGTAGSKEFKAENKTKVNLDTEENLLVEVD